jgi:hypothetical protein
MAVVQIPTPVSETNPSTTLTTTLDGKSYRIFLHYCGRENRWYGSIQDADGVELAGLEKLVADVSPWYRYRTLAGMPPGRFLLWDSSGEGIDPGLADLGGRCLLLYNEAGNA